MDKGSKIIYETDRFSIWVPNPPHIDRLDGGHIVISAKRYVDSRLDLTPSESIEVMMLTQLSSQAVKEAFKKQGIDIARFNYQENGNWAFLNNTKPFFHIHIYGRTINSPNQKWGEALYFPDPETKFNKKYNQLTDEDVSLMQEEIQRLLKTEKYDLNNWKL